MTAIAINFEPQCKRQERKLQVETKVKSSRKRIYTQFQWVTCRIYRDINTQSRAVSPFLIFDFQVSIVSHSSSSGNSTFSFPLSACLCNSRVSISLFPLQVAIVTNRRHESAPRLQGLARGPRFGMARRRSARF